MFSCASGRRSQPQHSSGVLVPIPHETLHVESDWVNDNIRNCFMCNIILRVDKLVLSKVVVLSAIELISQ